MAEKFTTPFAECMYPFLQQPKVDRNGEYEDTFEITLVLGKEHKELLNQIAALHKEAGGKEEIGEKRHPIKYHTDLEGNKIEDKFQIRFRTKADFCDHISTFDAEGHKLEWEEKNFVANGSVVRVNWTYSFYNMKGNKGVSLFLNGVQIKELIRWSGYSAEEMGFNKTEGYEATPFEEDHKAYEEAKNAVESASGPSENEGKGDMITEAEKKTKAAQEESKKDEEDPPF